MYGEGGPGPRLGGGGGGAAAPGARGSPPPPPPSSAPVHTKNQGTSHHIKQTFVDELPLKIKFINRKHNLLKIF